MCLWGSCVGGEGFPFAQPVGAMETPSGSRPVPAPGAPVRPQRPPAPQLPNAGAWAQVGSARPRDGGQASRWDAAPRPVLIDPKVPPARKAEGPPVPQGLPVTASPPFLDFVCLIWKQRIIRDYEVRISQGASLSFVTLTGLPLVCLLVPHVLRTRWGSLDDVFIWDAKISEMTMDPFFFVKEKYFDCLLWQAALLLGTLKWVQHKIVFIPSKHALSSLPRAGGGVGKVQPPWHTAPLLFSRSFLLLPLHSPCTPHFPLHHDVLSFQRAQLL